MAVEKQIITDKYAIYQSDCIEVMHDMPDNSIDLSIYSPVYRDWETDRKSTRLNSSHSGESRMPSSA